MWGEFCNAYAPTGEEYMDLYTLEKLYSKLDNQLEYLKENKSESV